MSHLYNRSGVPAYGMDPERAAPGSPEPEDPKARRPPMHAPAARGGGAGARSTSYLIVLMAGIILVLGFTAFGRARPPAAALVAPPCDCPKESATSGAFGALGAGAALAARDDAAGVPEGGSQVAAPDGDDEDESGAGGEQRKLAQGELVSTHRLLKRKRPSDVRRTALNNLLAARDASNHDDAEEGPDEHSVPKAVPTPPRPIFVPRPIQPASPKSILITGAAGFIGSHFALLLLDRGGFKVTAVDDMSRSSWDTVLRLQELAKASKNADFQFVKQNLAEPGPMAALMRERSVEAVVHFAGNAYVGESMRAPDKYFQNITVGTLQLLQAMEAASVRSLIFSSSCATFGEPAEFPITEETPQRPTSPYGLSKLHAEQSILAKSRVLRAKGGRFAVASLRYFNVMGADPAGRLGPVLVHREQWDYPRIIDAAIDAALGLRAKLTIMGAAFPTEDGTAVRDYIHVTDLVQAHLDALDRLDPDAPLVYNVGVGRGYTVKKVIKLVESVSGKTVPTEVGPPRPGDPHTLFSDPAKIKAELGWEPKYPQLEQGIAHAWHWRLANYPKGHASVIDPLAYAGPAYTAETDTSPPLRDDPRILIVGAGPTGLCAAYRLKELGYTNWQLIDKGSKAGGLATSVTDAKGFTWDIGVHVLFSHFEFFDALLDEYLQPKEWLYHQRWSPAWMRQRWVGYPIQANVWRLPEAEVAEIVADLATLKPPDAAAAASPPRNFLEWLHNGFGKALTKSFMAPYNFKVWAHPPEQLNTNWVGERVATIKFADILSNVINRKDAPAWGPNAQFRYPMNGTGHIWQAVFDGLPKENIKLDAELVAIRDTPPPPPAENAPAQTGASPGGSPGGDRSIELRDGTRLGFDALLSTVPVDQLLKHAFPDNPEMAAFADSDEKFKHQTVNLVGVGIWGQPPASLNGVHWVYFPEEDFPFYRVTVLSNFSPHVVPKPFEQWSLLVEVSESKYRPVPKSMDELKAKVLDGLRLSTMLPADARIESVWADRLEYGYPVPYVERNMHMHKADAALRQSHIWSRGRFGSWKYEVANQDHSCMLGVDAIDAMLFGGNAEGVEATFNTPNKVNNRYRPYNRAVDAAKELAAARPRPDGAPRRHTHFTRAPVHLEPLPTWSAVAWHCRESDAWASAFKAIVPPVRTKFFVHSYERCGVGDVKRPAGEMLYEGLHHLDRIPHGAARTNASAIAHHARAFHARLPDRLLIVRPGALGGHLPAALGARLRATDFAFAAVAEAGGAVGAGSVPLTPALCTLYKAALGLDTAAQCPESAPVVVGWQLIAASAQRVRAVPAERWAAIEAAVDASASAASAEGAERLLVGLLPQILGESVPLKPELVIAPDLAPVLAAATDAATAAVTVAATASAVKTATAAAATPAAVAAPVGAAAAAPAAGAVAAGGKGTAAEEADKLSP